MQEEAIKKLCPAYCNDYPILELEHYIEKDKEVGRMKEWTDDPLDMTELLSALNSNKKSSSLGLDQISYQIIALLPPPFLRKMLSIFNNFLKSSIFLSDWNDSLVVFVPKIDGESVRPISLLSRLKKLFEKCLYNRIK